jgi:hypothetical protein
MPGRYESPGGIAADSALDDLALLADAGLSRRQILLRAAGLTLAALIPSWLPVGRAWSRGRLPGAGASTAKYGICSKQPQGTCNGALVEWTPQCAKPVSRGRRATHNGCGPQGGVEWKGINVGDLESADKPLGLADFTSSCNEHDCCYGTCGANKARCDLAALEGWQKACRQAVGGAPGSVLDSVQLAYCFVAASAYYEAISSEASVDAFNAAQAEACACCEGHEDGPCGGKTCPAGQECCQGSICIDPKVSRCCNLATPYVCPRILTGIVDGKPAPSNVLCVETSGSGSNCITVPGRTDYTCAELLSAECSGGGVCWNECSE